VKIDLAYNIMNIIVLDLDQIHPKNDSKNQASFSFLLSVVR